MFKNKFSHTKKYNHILWISIMVFILIIFLLLIGFIDFNGFNKRLLLINRYAISKMIISGACIGIGSYLIQLFTKNKLADTSILGIGNINGLSLVVVAHLLSFTNPNAFVNNDNFYQILSIFFMVGSIIASFLLFFLSKTKHGANKKIIVIGIFINFFFIALSTMLSLYLDSGKRLLISNYLNGFIDQYNNKSIPFCFVLLIILIIWLILISRQIKITVSNEMIAKKLGINVSWVNFQVILISGILSGIAYVLVGNLMFLGIVAGNITFFLFKKNIVYGIFSTSFISIILLSITFFLFVNILPIATDNKLIVNPINMISLICTPYFIYLIFKS